MVNSNALLIVNLSTNNQKLTPNSNKKASLLNLRYYFASCLLHFPFDNEFKPSITIFLVKRFNRSAKRTGNNHKSNNNNHLLFQPD